MSETHERLVSLLVREFHSRGQFGPLAFPQGGSREMLQGMTLKQVNEFTSKCEVNSGTEESLLRALVEEAWRCAEKRIQTPYGEELQAARVAAVRSRKPHYGWLPGDPALEAAFERCQREYDAALLSAVPYR